MHRDVKPQNCMLDRDGRVVLIDFGFAGFVGAAATTTAKRKNNQQHQPNSLLCLEQPGRVKGDVGYVLARDVALYRGCAAGDCYAMGKTLYEVLFVAAPADTSPSQRRQEITVERAQRQNDAFRALLDGDPCQSRFDLSPPVRHALLRTIRGLCRETAPLSFPQAEALLEEQLAAAAQRM